MRRNVIGLREQPRRIAVSGFAGSGKTALCAALGERLAVPVLSEDMECIEAVSSPQPPGKEGAVRKNLSDLLDAMIAWHERRKTAYKASPAFVADKWEADILAWSMIEFPPSDSAAVDSRGIELVRMVQSSAAEIDCVVMMPFQMPFLPSGSRDAAGMERRFGFTRLLLWETVMTGIIKRFTGIPVLKVPAGMMTVQARADAVLAGLGSTAAGRK